MTQQKAPWTQTAFGLILIVLAVAIGAIILRLAFIALMALQKEVAAAIIAGMVTTAVSIFSVLFAKRLERKSVIEQQLRAKKEPVYESLILFLFKMFNATREGKDPVPFDDVIDFTLGFTQQIIIWGSDEVIREWSRFRKESAIWAGNDPSGLTVLLNMEKILLAIRKDLGHKNADFQSGTLLGLFINDIDELISKSSSTQLTS